MDPARLREILAVLRDAGVKSASVAAGDLLNVEFFETPEAATPFVGKDGKPVNLDDGAGLLARDPDADLETANFPKREPGG